MLFWRVEIGWRSSKLHPSWCVSAMATGACTVSHTWPRASAHGSADDMASGLLVVDRSTHQNKTSFKCGSPRSPQSCLELSNR